jgi:hypothetical protein
MNIREFPLAWRWTDSRYAVFSEVELSQLEPLGNQEAQIVFKRLRHFSPEPGLTHPADASDESVRAWLRERHGDLTDVVTVSWSPNCALHASWQIFCDRWSDFCYPGSDDVAVSPESQCWVLFYHHEEQFKFVQRQKVFSDMLPPTHGYFLSDVRLEVPNPTTAIFKARLNAPQDNPVWARAWLSTEAGTLAEAASAQLTAGDEVTLEVKLQTAESPQFAYMRIESAPLQTEHVVMLRLA